jgi:transposase InsO family protein
MMCQHFYGHKIKLLLATFRNQQVTCNHSLDHDDPIAPNLLNRALTVDKLDTCYVGDITYIATREGWLYPLCFNLHSFCLH